MAKVKTARVLTQAREAERRTVDEVLAGLRPPQGASPKGSTYWRKPLTCSREHYLGNIVQLRSRHTEALDVGTLFHLGLETYYCALYQLQKQLPLDKAPETLAFEAIAPFANEPGFETTYETVVRMLDAYFSKYEQDTWEVVAVEFTLESTGAPFTWTSRYDLAVIDHKVAGGALYSVEHKSTRALSEDVIRGYTQDLQVMGQIWLFDREIDLSFYPPYMGACVNLVSKTKNPECVRLPVSPTPAALKNWEAGMTAAEKLMPIQEALGYPQNFAMCMRKFGPCDFFEICQFRPDATLEELKKEAEEKRNERNAAQL